MGRLEKLFGKRDRGTKAASTESRSETDGARRILGEKNVFGPDEWKKSFGKKFQVTSVPEIPWSVDVLGNPGIDQEHFLFLGLDVLGGEPLDIAAWDKLYPGDGDPKLYWIPWNKQTFARRTCELRWYLVLFCFDKHWAPYDNLFALLPNTYEVPGITELVTATVLYYLLNKKYPDTEGWMAYTRDKTNDGYRAIFRTTAADGAQIIDNLRLDDAGDMLNTLGIAASRKLP